MGQVCSVLREKIFCWKSSSRGSSTDSSSVFLPEQSSERQNNRKPDVEVQDDAEVVPVKVGTIPEPPQHDTLPAEEVVPQVVTHDTSTSDSTAVDTLIDITNLPTENAKISEYVTPRPSLKSFRERSNSSSSDQSSKKVKVDDYLDFPVLKDAATKKFIVKSKVLVVMRGLSGSGKSYITEKLLELYGDNAVECSADTFFVQPDGKYVFDGSKIKDAHNSCYDRAAVEVAAGRPLVVINNTHIKFWEYKRYLYLAKDHHYSVLLMIPQTPWVWDPVELALRTQHGLDEKFLRDKANQFQPSQPVYYGWFLNPADSSLLVQRSWACLRAVTELPQCRRSLAYYCYKTAPDHMQGGASGLVSYYSLCGHKASFQPLHCTAMFANRGKSDGAKEYGDRVLADMGRVFSVLVTGFVITPRTIGVRLVLPDEALRLWEQDDQEDHNLPPNVEELFALVQGQGAGQQALEEQDALDAGFDAGQLTVHVPDVDHNSTTTRPVPFDRVQQLCGAEGPSLHRLRPFRRQGGRRAHFTVAVAPGVQPVTTGFDLMHLTTLEDAAAEQEAAAVVGGVKTSSGAGQEPMEVDGDQGNRSRGKQLYTVQGGTVADYGQGVFAFYPDECLEVTGFFSANY